MKFLKNLTIAFMLTVGAYAQFGQGEEFAPTILTLTVDTTAAAGSSPDPTTNLFSDSVIVPNGMVPIGYFCDSLSYGASGNFQIAVGPIPNRWYNLGGLADSIAYTFPLDDSAYIPFNANVMASIMGTTAGIVGTYASTSPIWIKLILSIAQKNKKYFYIRTRYF